MEMQQQEHSICTLHTILHVHTLLETYLFVERQTHVTDGDIGEGRVQGNGLYCEWSVYLTTGLLGVVTRTRLNKNTQISDHYMVCRRIKSTYHDHYGSVVIQHP